jgi:transcriptional regulator with XRE-family HTH domain
MNLGKELRDMRLALNLTQRDVSTALGYTTAQFISNWERNVSQPPVEALKILAKLYGVSPQSIVRLIFEHRQQQLEQDKKAALKAVKS